MTPGKIRAMIKEEIGSCLSAVRADISWLKWAVGLLYPVLMTMILTKGG